MKIPRLQCSAGLARLVLPAATAMAIAGSLDAQCRPAFDNQNEFWAFYWENDTFYDTDQSYTNGVRISRVGPITDSDDPWWLPTDVMSALFSPSCARDPLRGWDWSGGWAIGHHMYTPQDITIAEVVTDDRPYGGWLYVGLVFNASRNEQSDQRATQHTIELDIGVTGEASLADDIQTFVHEHVRKSAPEPMGWEHQIPTTLGILARYSGRHRLWAATIKNSRAVDLSPTWEAGLGNIFTYVGVGGTLRLGYNLGRDFGPERITPVAHGMNRSDWEAYGFVAGNARGVAHNIFLDGTGDAPQTVDRKALVGDFEVGGTVRIKSIALTFRWVRRSPEFEERDIFQQYGAWNLTVLH